LRVPGVARIVEHEMTRRERRAYDVAVEALRGEGCHAGGKRLAAIGDDDSPMCQRSLTRTGALITETFRDLSASGRRRSDQPPCCEDVAAPPTLSDELEAQVFDLFSV
jgi:hypothetical protein